MLDHLLSWMTFSPLLGILVILILPGSAKNLIRWTAFVATLIPLVFAGLLFSSFDRLDAGFQFVEQYSWISTFNIEYYMGTDGISVTMILLTALLCPICILASWNIEKALKGYFALFLLLETGMIGVFCALDLFLFYIYWEVMLLPMYFLIGIWGGPRKEYAAIKFFLYTLVGSVFLLLGILALYYYGPENFNMVEMARNSGMYSGGALKIFGWPFEKVVFIALFFGFAIKVPMFPFHTWLPDAHVEAPTAVSVILAGVLLKMGIYGIFRICYPILPDAAVWFAPALAIFGVINIIYGALCAMDQKDFKKLVAYSSISHMGYCLLGLAAMTRIGMTGSLYQMFTHGTVTAMLFLIVGVIYDRTHTRGLNDFGGLAHKMPIYTTIAVIAIFASLGLPGLAGFISEAAVLIGSFNADQLFQDRYLTDMMMFKGPNLFKICTILAAVGVILTASYLLWTLQRVFLGPLNEKWKDLPEISWREIATLAPLAFLVIALGVYPMPILDLMDASMKELASSWIAMK